MSILTGAESRAIAEQSVPFQFREQTFAIKGLNIDANGRLRVAAESGAVVATQSGTWNIGTTTTLTNLTNWGLFTATVRSQVDSMLDFNTGYRRNLVVS